MASGSTLLAIGFGYSAEALARRLLDRDWRVIGTTRSEERAAQIRAIGVEPAPWPPSTEVLDEATHLLISAAPGAEGDPSLVALGEAIRERADRFKWVGYLSTTGVYGDKAGEWVDEESPLNPATERGERRVKAEAEWRGTGVPLHIFRIAGIYGPGRGPFAKLRNGTARRIIKQGQVFSRIHRDDIAASLAASIDQPRPGGVYNLCDDLPAPPQQVTEYAASLLNMPPPPEEAFETAEMSPMARSFYSESKRVSNRRIRDELGVALAYPTYREGLQATLAEEEAGGAI
ncbi:MAG: SDR family oxidoreductase [Pseudomonadota bacterium]